MVAAITIGIVIAILAGLTKIAIALSTADVVKPNDSEKK